MTSIDDRLAELGLELPEAPQPVANYVPFLLSGDQLFISGQISKDGSGRVLTGTLGKPSPSSKDSRPRAIAP
jgi:enamine deaminase RidA (YjgF/YER057c/UK114 family)